MGAFRGNPLNLTLLFFGLAVFLCGTLYTVGGRALAAGDRWLLAAAAVLLFLLAFTILILARILAATSRAAGHSGEELPPMAK